MQTVCWYLVCFCLITSGYADITEEQMTNFKDEILVAISKLSENMNYKLSDVSKKVDKMEKRFEIMQGQVSGIEVAADAANLKASLMHPDVSKIVNSVADMAVAIDSLGNNSLNNVADMAVAIDSLGNSSLNNFDVVNITLACIESKLKDIYEYMNLTEKEKEHKMVYNFENVYEEIVSVRNKVDELGRNQSFTVVNITLSSLELKLKDIYEYIGLTEKEQERKMVYNFENMNEEIGSVSNKIEELGRNLSVIATQQENRIVRIEKKVPPRNCNDLYNQGSRVSTPVQIFPYSCCPNDSVSVICDGRWTTIQQRQDVQPRENFTRPWAEYVQGFGMVAVNREFWIGLKLIHELSSQSTQELHIALEDWEGNKRYANYSYFSVGPPEDNYRLNVTGYSGDAGDALTSIHNGHRHTGQAFSTYDQDNDKDYANCAKAWKGGWWYSKCHRANLNGQPDIGHKTTRSAGINWYQWRGYEYSLRLVKIKIRPII